MEVEKEIKDKIETRIENKLDKFDQEISEETKEMAIQYLLDNRRTATKTALAISYYINNNGVSQDSAGRKFNVRTNLSLHAERMANLLDIDKSEYRESPNFDFKDKIDRVAEILNWEEGEHYNINEIERLNGDNHIRYSLLRPGEIQLINYVLERESDE